MKLTSLSETPETDVSHNAAIKRKRMIEFGEVAHLTNFSKATFPPGEIAWAHSHDDMVEVFFVLSGEATMVVNDEPYALTQGSCIKIDCGESHELQNTGSTPLEVLYFGVI